MHNERKSKKRSSLGFEKNQMLIITRSGEAPKLWTVAKSNSEGWLLRSLASEGETDLFLHDEIFKLYVEGRLKILGRQHRIMTADEEMRTRRSWESAPIGLRMVADRRFQILRGCIETRANFQTMAECFQVVPGQIVAKFQDVWANELKELLKKKKKENGTGLRYDTSALDRYPVEWVPKERTMWSWFKRCGNSEPNVRRLLPRDHMKGDTRSLFGAQMVELMEQVIEEHYLKPPPKSARYVYTDIFEGKAKALLGDAYIPPEENGSSGQNNTPDDDDVTGTVAGNEYPDESGKGKRNINQYPSYLTFTRRIKQVRADAKMRGLSGNRAANLEYGTFSEAEPPPFMLHQVEVDHSFINMWVRDKSSGRVIGRPWITAIRDRTTKVILGLHVSFLPPSWMTLSRAVAHALWPKDMSGFSSTWDYHGVFDWMVTDRGLDFLCDGLRLTGRLVGFEIGNLQGFSPWLKGGLERLFRRLKGQIFDYRPGTSAWRALKHYDGRAATTMDHDELRHELIQWVGKYHRSHHSGLGMAPDERWGMEIETHGSPRGISEFQDLRRLFCKTETRSIGRSGIEYDGLLFNDPCLADLKGRGGGKGWDIMIDPYNLGSIFLHDPQAGPEADSWLEIACTRPDLSQNVTQHQHDLHKLLARLSKPGERVTEAMLEKGKKRANAFLEKEAKGKARSGTDARLARYRDEGSFLTPVTIRGKAPQLNISRTVDWGTPELDPVTGRPLGEALFDLALASGGKEPRQPVTTATKPEPESGADDAAQATDHDYESAILEATAMMRSL